MEKSTNGFLSPTMDSQERPVICCITSYPPRECGIATYSEDLIAALRNKFGASFSFAICALESEDMKLEYPPEVKGCLDTSDPASYEKLARRLNDDDQIKAVLIQHEFGFFAAQEKAFLSLLYEIRVPVIVVFHTVLPNPDDSIRSMVCQIASAAESVVVMTNNASDILAREYTIAKEKISVIPHGTHLVPFSDKKVLKEKYDLQDRLVLSTFGLLSSGKSIETTLEALPKIIQSHPKVMFLILGKTHPGVVKHEGERYRQLLETKVRDLHLESNVRFVNTYLSLTTLLEYLQLTDIYLFTSKDPNQAVSGTFAYALSCHCPIISTPIPHARELLTTDTGILIDFQNSVQLAEAVLQLANDEPKRHSMSLNALRTIVPSAWENAGIGYGTLLHRVSKNLKELQYAWPPVKLDHIKALTTDFGMIQFSTINLPDLASGYTLDDNARALIASTMHLESTVDKENEHSIRIYLNFIEQCQQRDGSFLNYIGPDRHFSAQNTDCNLEDANGRAIWALGFLLSKKELLPHEILSKAEQILQGVLTHSETMYSSRAMAFSLKGLCGYYGFRPDNETLKLIRILATRLADMYLHESEDQWRWFESYLTYGNSVLPEAMLFASEATGDNRYKTIAKESFDFLLSKTFNARGIKPISNKTWLRKGGESACFGEQPIDVAYTILALRKFYDCFQDEGYYEQMTIAFDWFLGRNHLNQIMYNPRTGGCYDGLEEKQVNLNQGAESTLSYLMARLVVEHPGIDERPFSIGSPIEAIHLP